MKQFSFQSAGIGSQTAPPSSPAQRQDSSGFSEGFLKGSLRLGCFCVIGAATAAHRWRQRRRHTSEPWQDYSGFSRSIQDFFQDSSRITFIEREGWFFWCWNPFTDGATVEDKSRFHASLRSWARSCALRRILSGFLAPPRDFLQDSSGFFGKVF